MSASHPNESSQMIRWLALSLAGLTLLLFAPAMRFDYVDYDDGVYVYGNLSVLKGLSLEGVRYAFTSIAGGSWMPLTWLSYMLDVSLAGPTPDGLHTTNVLLHAANAALLFLILQRMTNQAWPAGIVAAIFAFHPLRNESVAWISERKDVLSTFFLLLALLAYTVYVERPNWRRYLLVVSCFLLGLLAKPMIVTFPFLLLLLDLWPLRRMGASWKELRQILWPRVREKLPLFLITVIFCVLTYVAQNRYGAVSQLESSFAQRLIQVAGNYGFYLGKFFVPTGLNAIHPELKTSVGQAILISVIGIAFSSIALWQMFRRPWLAVGWFWFLGLLIPVVGIVRIGHISVAERYSYFSSVGLTFFVTWAAWSLCGKNSSLRWSANILGIAAALACAFLTMRDLPRWKDSLALFSAAIETDPHPVAYNNIGVVYLDRRDYERAIEPLTRAIELDPRYVKAYINRITAYQKTGRQAEAKADLAELVKIEPRNAEGYTGRGDVLLDLERYEEAIADFSAVIQLSPNDAKAYNNRATARLMKGDDQLAIADCRRALELNPRYANAYNTLGNIYHRSGAFSQALENYNHAAELAPGDALTYNNRAAVYFALKQYDAAWVDLRRCEARGGTPHAGLIEALNKVAPLHSNQP